MVKIIINYNNIEVPVDMPSQIQAVLFDKDRWNSPKARVFLRRNKFKPIKRVHKTRNYLRYRLQNPKKYKSFRTRNLANGVNLIFGIY